MLSLLREILSPLSKVTLWGAGSPDLLSSIIWSPRQGSRSYPATWHSSWIHERQEDPDAWWWSQKADCGDCGCNSHSWDKACRQWAAATAAGVDRLLCHLRAAAGEGREETGLQQRTPPIHHHLPQNPSSPPHFLWLRKEWGTERETYHQVLDKLRVKLRLQSEHRKGAKSRHGGSFLGNQPIRD